MKAPLVRFFGRNSTDSANEIVHLPIEEINISSFQPRKNFHQENLHKLSQSIQEVGVIQPILVRKTAEGLELVAGERRLRASKIAGLKAIPAIVKEIGDREAAEIALIENLQREDLDYFEEAEGYQRLIAEFGFTQEELAKRISKSQAAVANKLRILKLPPLLKEKIDCQRITERHVRALLKLPEEKYQKKALKAIYTQNLTVQQTEALVENLIKIISREIIAPPRKRKIQIIKDLRIFINAIKTTVDGLKKNGIQANMKQTEEHDALVLTIFIPKGDSEKKKDLHKGVSPIK